MAEAIFYVYKYVDQIGTPYYIGKGKGTRIHDKHTHTILPPIEYRHYVETKLTELAALALENQLIRQYGRKADGGLLDNTKLNQWACSSGWKHSEETKRLISEKNTGKIRTEEHKTNYRKPKTAEHAANISKANIGRPIDGRYAKTSATTKGRPWTAARRAAYNKSKEMKGST